MKQKYVWPIVIPVFLLGILLPFLPVSPLVIVIGCSIAMWLTAGILLWSHVHILRSDIEKRSKDREEKNYKP